MSKTLPGLYYNIRSHHAGTVTLEPDFDAVMFQRRDGVGQPDQWSPDEAGARLRLVERDPNGNDAGIAWSKDPIDWQALLDAEPDVLEQIIAEGESAGPGFADKVKAAMARRVGARTGAPAWLPDDWTAGGAPHTYFGPHGEEVYRSDLGWAVATGVVRETDAELDLDLCSLVFALAHPGQAPRSARPTFAGLAAFADTGFLQEVNRLVLHPAGRVLCFVQDSDTGAILDVTIQVTDDPSGMAFLPDADGVAEFTAKAERVAREIMDRAAARTADPDLGGHLIEPVPGLGLDYEAVAFPKSDPDYVRGVEIMVERVRSFLLADDVLDASQRQTAAHDAAMRILGQGGKEPDPRATMRGEIARLSAEVERLKAAAISMIHWIDETTADGSMTGSGDPPVRQLREACGLVKPVLA